MEFVQKFLIIGVSFSCRWVLLIVIFPSVWAYGKDFLPDGSEFPFWEDRTIYTRTLHVDRSHPATDDNGPGTLEQPFKTINAAAQQVRPGERLLIHEGIYREEVRPMRGGTGPDQMISFEAAAGENVVIRGSRIHQESWQRSLPPGGQQETDEIWMTVIPEVIHAGDYRPFRTPNLTDEEFDKMPWANWHRYKEPYILPRGLVFEDGRRLVQRASYAELSGNPGSYWVGPNGQTLHVNPYADGDPAECFWELAVQRHLLAPEERYLGYIRISGITFEHCANSLMRSEAGALYTAQGHHWIIENNTVREVNSVGIEFGDFSDWMEKERALGPDHGYNIVRRNHVHDCGTAGLRSLGVRGGLIEDNVIHDCGWQDAERHWEAAGIKLLVNRGTLVRNNHIYRIRSGCGIWMDWDNRNARVTGNLIHDVETVSGAIVVEASKSVNSVDNNIIWNIKGVGIRCLDTDNAWIMHNFIGRVTGDPVLAHVVTDRSVQGEQVSAVKNRVFKNIFFDCEKPVLLESEDNRIGGNLYVHSFGREAVGAAPIGIETNSIKVPGDFFFNPAELTLAWRLLEQPSFVQVEDFQVWPSLDYLGCERSPEKAFAGPFGSLPLRSAAEVSRSAWPVPFDKGDE